MNKLIFPLSILLLAITPSLPFANSLIQSSMAFHMLVQLPMLVLAGYLIAQIGLINKIYHHSLSSSLSVTLAQWLFIYLASVFWMLPISLDQALIAPEWAIFKIVSLVTTGILLQKVFKSHRLLALFFIGSMAMMLFFVGYYYQDTDIRLCNAYLIESQQLTGTGLMAAASLLLLFLFYRIKISLK